MSARRGALPSAQAVDPITWYTSPYGPLAFSVLALVYGVIMSFASWPIEAVPVQLVALALPTLSCVVVYVATQPLRRAIGWPLALVVVAMPAAAMVLSALAAPRTGFAVELWWAPVGLALAIISLAPYLAPHRLAIVGVGSTAIGSALALIILTPTLQTWPPLGLAVIIGYAPALATVSTSTFSAAVVHRTLDVLESPNRALVAGPSIHDAIEEVERATIAKFTSRAAPFLESVAAAGRITAQDRVIAGDLARELRDDLLSQSNSSWLNSVDTRGRLIVIDPEHRAKLMNSPQRTALRGLLRAVVDAPSTPEGAATIELSVAEGGATDVVLTLDAELPDDDRAVPLAPYYLALQTCVDNLSFDGARPIQLSFRVPPKESEFR